MFCRIFRPSAALAAEGTGRVVTNGARKKSEKEAGGVWVPVALLR